MTLDLPECLGQRAMNALKANPKVVDLRQLVGGGGYFYGVTGRVLELFEEDEVGNVVGEVSCPLVGLGKPRDGMLGGNGT